jgi:hypothetical protein
LLIKFGIIRFRIMLYSIISYYTEFKPTKLPKVIFPWG